jgi:hypothetical protein
MKMNMKLNVEELRREILEGARAVPLCRAGGRGGRSEKNNYAGRDCEVEDGGEKETSVLCGGGVELREVDVSLESGMLGYLSHKL